MTLSAEVRAMVSGWLRMHGGDREALARWMRDSLHAGGIRECREIIADVLAAEATAS